MKSHFAVRDSAEFVLEHLDGRLCIRLPARPEWTPLAADWLSAEMLRRIAGGRRQLLARAVGMRKDLDLHVIDATAGLGRDGFTLAALGARVSLLERQAPIAAVLRDARQRALADPRENLRAAATRITIIETDSRSWLALNTIASDTVYLDPMYPHAGKSALPQKDMQLLRAISGGDSDADTLLSAALASPARRIAVKRAAAAPPLAGRRPDAQLRGSQARFDIYLGSVDI